MPAETKIPSFLFFTNSCSSHPTRTSGSVFLKKRSTSVHRLVLLLLAFFLTCSFANSRELNVVSGPVLGPTITTQPTDRTICADGQAIFLIAANNATTYKWQIDTGLGFNDLAISGVYSLANNNLVVSGATSGMAGYKYRCIVGDANSVTVTSSAGELKFYPASQFSAPLADKTVLIDGNTSIKVIAYYTLQIKWQVQTSSEAEFVDITDGGAYSISGDNSTNTLTITGATAQMNGYKFRAVGTNVCSVVTNSNAATLTVSPAPAITTEPIAVSICADGNTAFSVAASNATGYKWQVNQGSSWFDLTDSGPYSGTQSSILTITGAPGYLDGFRYQAIVSGAASSTVTSSAVALTINQGVAITTQPVAAEICSGDNGVFSVVASNATSYQWQADLGSGFNNISDSSPYSGTNTNQLTITAGSGDLNGIKYRCLVNGLCSSQKVSDEVLLNVGVPGLWLGTKSSDWNTPENWSCGSIPTVTTDVVIPASASYMPEIDNVYDAICRDLTIESGATLKISGALFEIGGKVTNNGTFDRSGPVVFSGSDQFIPEGDYFELGIKGPGLKKLEGNTKVETLLILGGGHIELGSFNLTLSSTGDAMVEEPVQSFVVTNGTGSLVREGVGNSSAAVLFPVGASTTSYTPITIANSGTPDSYSARVITGVYSAYDAQDVPTGNALPENNVNKTWFVGEGTAGGSDVTLTLMWNEGDQQTGFDPAVSFGSHYMNGKWSGAPVSEAGLGQQFFTSLTEVSSFSPFGVGSVGGALPLTLLSFKAVTKEGQVDLNWETANEVNTAGFEIEHSNNARIFSKIGYVSADKNAGYKVSYNFKTGRVATSTTNYYRLKMIDADGTFAYSKMVNVSDGEASDGYTVYPNPAVSEEVTLKSIHGNQALDLTVFDVHGIIRYQAKKQTDNQSTLQIPVKDLPGDANYFIRITTPEGEMQNLKFFKK